MIRRKIALFFSITTILILSACGNSHANPIQSIENEMHYMDVDDEREYVITFLEDNRADVAWYGRENSPESVSFEMSEEKVEVLNQDPMYMISFDNIPTHSYGLSNSNDNSFLIDETEKGIVLRDYVENQDSEIYLRNDKEFEKPRFEATEEEDIFLVKAD